MMTGAPGSWIGKTGLPQDFHKKKTDGPKDIRTSTGAKRTTQRAETSSRGTSGTTDRSRQKGKPKKTQPSDSSSDISKNNSSSSKKSSYSTGKTRHVDSRKERGNPQQNRNKSGSSKQSFERPDHLTHRPLQGHEGLERLRMEMTVQDVVEKFPKIVDAFYAYADVIPQTVENLREFADAVNAAEDASGAQKRALGRKINDMIEKFDSDLAVSMHPSEPIMDTMDASKLVPQKGKTSLKHVVITSDPNALGSIEINSNYGKENNQ